MMFAKGWKCFCCPSIAKAPRRHIISPIPPAPVSPELLPLPPPSALAAEMPAQQLQITPTGRRGKKRSDLSTSLFAAKFRSRKNRYFFAALAAVVIIQTWFRRRRALFEIRRKTAWTIYQHIEYAGEQDQLKV